MLEAEKSKGIHELHSANPRQYPIFHQLMVANFMQHNVRPVPFQQQRRRSSHQSVLHAHYGQASGHVDDLLGGLQAGILNRLDPANNVAKAYHRIMLQIAIHSACIHRRLRLSLLLLIVSLRLLHGLNWVLLSWLLATVAAHDHL